MAELRNSDSFFTVVYSPSYKKHLAFSGKVRSLSSANSEGNFDILPLHENFISIVNGPVVIVDENGKRQEVSVEKALVEVSSNIVKVFVDY